MQRSASVTNVNYQCNTIHLRSEYRCYLELLSIIVSCHEFLIKVIKRTYAFMYICGKGWNFRGGGLCNDDFTSNKSYTAKAWMGKN